MKGMWLRLVMLSLLLAGCVSTPQSVIRLPEAAQKGFTLNGRIAVKYDGQHESGGLHWEHEGQVDDVTLLAPLGITVAHVQRNSQGAMLEASGRQYFAPDSTELMRRTLGWHLPLDGMHYWVMALPEPGVPATVERDAQGRASLMRQSCWEIRYTAYFSPEADSLPKRMDMRCGKLQIRLVIDEWKTK